MQCIVEGDIFRHILYLRYVLLYLCCGPPLPLPSPTNFNFVLTAKDHLVYLLHLRLDWWVVSISYILFLVLHLSLFCDDSNTAL